MISLGWTVCAVSLAVSPSLSPIAIENGTRSASAQESAPKIASVQGGTPRAAKAAEGAQHPPPVPGAKDEPSTAEPRALFLANCAACHGETGDGQGTTKLEKPARSFKDGGFSYGNTPAAVLRTITNGIPGTPMPSFSSALKEVERKALAQYVISLGPPETKVDTADTILVVHEQPLFVRAKLPPIVEGAVERPRGLFVGTIDGLTFEYRVDDLRLLGVRQGGFVERMDWQGRGGDPQKPLGKLVYLFGDGNPGPTFSLQDLDNGGLNALSERFAATFAREGRAWVASVLWADTQPVRVRQAWVEDSPHALASTIGSGFARTFNVEDLGNSGHYSLCVSRTKAAKAVGFEPGGSNGPKTSWIVLPRPDGTFEILLARGLKDEETFVIGPDGVSVGFKLDSGQARSLEFATLLAPKWDGEVQAKWMKEIQ
jgi:mono/diheme cytochrome c family protein